MAFIKNTDVLVEGQQNLFFSAERAQDAVSGAVGALSGAITGLQESVISDVSGLDSRLDVLEGSTGVEGSVARALYDAKAYTDQEVAALVASAPEVLDTLKELADALSGDANFAQTIAGQIGSLSGSLVTAEGDINYLSGAITGEASARQSADSYLSGVLTGVDSRLSTAEADITGLEGRMDAAESDITGLEGRMDTAESDITGLEGRMDTAEADITGLQGRMDTAEADITGLQGRMDTAESDITGLEGRMDTAESDITGLQGRMDTAESDITGLQGRMDTAESDITGLEGRMDTAESDITGLEGRMDTAESDITGLEVRVDALEGVTGMATEAYVDQAQSDAEAFAQDLAVSYGAGVSGFSSSVSLDFASTHEGLRVAVVSVSGGAVQLTLPAASGNAGRYFRVKDSGSSVASGSFVTVVAQDGETVDGVSGFQMKMPYESAEFFCDGDEWFVM